MKDKTIKLSEEGLFSVFHRIAAKKKLENPDHKPVKKIEDDLYYEDTDGREHTDPKIHEKFLEIENRRKALIEHNNDPNKRLDLCGFPKKDRDIMFTYDYKEVLKRFTGINIKISSWAFIHGPPGTGKTTLAMRLIWEWMKPEPARKATFLSVRDWMEEQYIKFGKNDKNEIPKLPNFKKYVILDDFDKILFSEWQILQIFRLIDYLDRNDKKVIITSNIGLSELLKKTKYDMNYKAIIDRIVGRTMKAILCMGGNSMRKIKR